MSVRSLPTGWKKSAMGEIGQYLNGFAFNSKTWGTTGRPIIRIQNLTGSGDSFNYFDGDIDDRYVVRNGDLLFSWAATLGVYLWSGPEAVLNQHIFKVKSLINTLFHRYLIEHNIALMTTQTHGTGMVHLTKKKFDAIPVEIPPRDEQERIVEILEEQLSRLDAAVKSVQTVREKAAQFRRSLLHAAFTGALTQTDPGRMSETAAPGSWRAASLGEACLKVRKIDPKVLGRETFRYVDIGAIDNGKNAIRLVEPIECETAPSRARQLLQTGDTVFSTVRPYLKNIAWVDDSLDGEIASTGFCVLRPNSKKLLPRFLFFFSLSDVFLEQILPLQRGVSYPAVRDGDLLGASIPLPPLAEQERIVEILEEQLSRLDATLAVADEVERKTKSLRRSLLHAAFTGELTRSWREAHV